MDFRSLPRTEGHTRENVLWPPQHRNDKQTIFFFTITFLNSGERRPYSRITTLAATLKRWPVYNFSEMNGKSWVRVFMLYFETLIGGTPPNILDASWSKIACKVKNNKWAIKMRYPRIVVISTIKISRKYWTIPFLAMKWYLRVFVSMFSSLSVRLEIDSLFYDQAAVFLRKNTIFLRIQ